MSEGNLRSAIGLRDAVAIEVGLIIGAGLFSLTGVATAIAGPMVFLAYLLSFAIVILGLIPTAMLGAAFPTTGGNYRYPSRLFSPHVAFLSTWGLAVSMFVGGLPLYALSFGEYVADLVPVDPTLVAVIALSVFWLANVAGIDIAARLQTVMFLSLVASLLLFIGFGLPAIEPANLGGFFTKGPTGLLTGAAVLYFVCLGANFVVDIGGELVTATTTIPRSFAVSVPLVMVLYVFTALVGVGTVGWTALAGQTLSVPARAFLSPTLATLFIVGGALFAIATTINAVFIIAPKYLLVLAADNVFPSLVARVNDRFGTPHWGLTVIYLVSIAAVLSPLPFDQLGSMLGFGGIFLIVPVMIGAIRFAREHPASYADAPFSPRKSVLYASAIGAVVLNTLLFAMLGWQSSGVFAIWLGLLGLGVAYYGVRRWRLARRGVEMPDVSGPVAEALDD
ncbi:MAG: APC family permease [Halodesulfurarchaeum sp.]